MEWDTAAAHAVLKAAGGSVFNLKDGEEIFYGKPEMDNDYFLAVGLSSALVKSDLNWRKDH
jgi:3'(2'), 5'-bisphosphate nucleotidase